MAFVLRIERLVAADTYNIIARSCDARIASGTASAGMNLSACNLQHINKFKFQAAALGYLKATAGIEANIVVLYQSGQYHVVWQFSKASLVMSHVKSGRLPGLQLISAIVILLQVGSISTSRKHQQYANR